MAGTVVFIESSSNDGGDPGATVGKVFDGSTVSGWVSSASVATNADNFLWGTTSVSDKVSNSTVTGYGLGAGVVGEPWDFSSGGTDEGNHIFMIINASGTRDTQVNGGYGIIAADDLGTDSFGTWYVGPQANSQGGWEYFVIDPEQDFDTVTAGSGSWTTTGNPAQLSGVDGIGVRWKITNTVMGASDNAFVQTGSIGVGYRITGTDAVFSEISTYENTNRYGALETKSGTLFPLCKIRVGTPSGAGNTTFVDEGFNVTWQGQTLSDGTSKATAVGFYGFFADQGTGTTDVTLTSGSLAAASPEEFDLALAGVNSVTCSNLSVDRARIVTLDSAVDWNGGTVKNSGQIDATDAIFENINVLTSSAAAGSGAVYWNSASDPDGNIDNNTYSQGAAAHSAIEFGTAVTGNITIRGCDFSGFNASDDVNGAVFKFLATSGSLNLTLVDCTHDGSGFTVDDTAGVTVTVITGAVTVKATAVDDGGVPIENARVHLRASDGTGPLPYGDAVTISRTTTTATVTHTAHGLNTNDKVYLRGITDKTADNGVQQVTVTSVNAYTFTTADSGSTSYTGSGFIINGQDETSYDNSPSTEGTFSGGTGHAVNDEITLRGGTKITVDAVSSGVVTQFTVDSGDSVGGRSAAEVQDQISSDGAGVDFSLTLDTDNLATEIRSTYVALDGDTDVNGEISISRVFGSNQSVIGWARKSTAAPYYKEGPINDAIDSTTGLDSTTVMVSDE